jgi:hypothetical protein
MRGMSAARTLTREKESTMERPDYDDDYDNDHDTDFADNDNA